MSVGIACPVLRYPQMPSIASLAATPLLHHPTSLEAPHDNSIAQVDYCHQSSVAALNIMLCCCDVNMQVREGLQLPASVHHPALAATSCKPRSSNQCNRSARFGASQHQPQAANMTSLVFCSDVNMQVREALNIMLCCCDVNMQVREGLQLPDLRQSIIQLFFKHLTSPFEAMIATAQQSLAHVISNQKMPRYPAALNILLPLNTML